MAHRVIVMSNALDDATRIERGITTDSPAASRKVFQLCMALRKAGVRTFVLSLGRGQAAWSCNYSKGQVRRVNGVPVIYAPFCRLRGVSELISLMAPVGIILRWRHPTKTAMIFYNRQLAYVPTLLAAALRGLRRFLDLEDGEVGRNGSIVSRSLQHGILTLYDRLCSSGALLACSALSTMTRIRPVLCFYGTAEGAAGTGHWTDATIRVLLGGTLAPETGIGMLVKAVQVLRRTRPAWAERLQLEITGKGPSLESLQSLAANPNPPRLIVHGRTNDERYRSLVEGCAIGLALKPRSGLLAQTTFPSKVVELASAGLLVITTDISDVRAVLGSGALYIERDDPLELVELLRQAVEQPEEARARAARGCQAVWSRCAPHSAGRTVADFIFGDR